MHTVTMVYYAELGIQPWALCMPSKLSTSWATSPALFLLFFRLLFFLLLLLLLVVVLFSK